MWPQVTTCVKDYVTFTVNAPTCIFDCNWFTEVEDIMYLVSHRITENHEIKK